MTIDVTAFELAALHHELAVDGLRCFDDFTVENCWRSPDAVWRTAGPYDQLNLESEVDMEEFARQTQCYVDAYGDPDSIDWFDPVFYSGHMGARGVRVSSSPQHVACQVWVCVWAKHWMCKQRRCCCRSKVHAQIVDGAGNNKADEGRDRGRGREEKAGGGCVVPPPAI